MRGRRRALPSGQRTRASQLLCSRLTSHPYYIQAGTVGIYFPNDGEINVTLLMQKDCSKRFYLPVLPPRGKRRLWFAHYEAGARLASDRFGIPEPITGGRVRAEDLDLLLVPLVAFDDKGGRIGMGGGFYDATLSFLLRPRTRPIRVIGAAYQFQKIDDIPKESWDIPLHGVISDQQFITAASPQRQADTKQHQNGSE